MLLSKEICVVWLVFTIIGAVFLSIPYLDSSRNIYKSIPLCLSKKQYNTPCFMCGSTSAFYLASFLKFNQAKNKNWIGLVVWASFWVNCVVFFYIFFRKKRFFGKQKR